MSLVLSQQIPFNQPYLTGDELTYLQQALNQQHLSGNGPLTQQCQAFMEQMTGSAKVLLTHSATAALEMSGLLMGLQPGDEVILPSFTFASTASAFVLSGATPVFVDIRPDTLNLDEERIEAAITDKTRAIVVVHYAGVACDMTRIQALAGRYNLHVIEDAAHAFGAAYQHRPLATLGDVGIFSFHETKNLISGEGGALVINREDWSQAAEIIWEKGTNRAQFFRGEVDKYTWVRPGSSYLPNELTAAVLWAQLQQHQDINARRMKVWQAYHTAFESLEHLGCLRRPHIPAECQHNAHLYYLLVNDHPTQMALIAHLKDHGIHAVFHYLPLHLSPAGQRFGRASGELLHTVSISERLIRLPLWIGMTEAMVQAVAHQVAAFFNTLQ